MKSRISFTVQHVKDPALSLQRLGSLMWHGFDPWPRDFQWALGMEKKKKKKRKKSTQSTHPRNIYRYINLNTHKHIHTRDQSIIIHYNP